MFLKKVVLKICSKFTGEHLCRSVNSIKLHSNFIEIVLRHGCSPVNLLHIFRTLFFKNTSGGCFCLLQDENTVQALIPSVITSTAGNFSTHGKSTSCSKIEKIAPPANSEIIKGGFCLDTVFNLSNKVFSQTEISVLEKGLEFVPTPNMINEADLRRDFDEFSRKKEV